MIEHLPTPPHEGFTWFHAIISGVGIFFLWMCGRLGHDINKIGPMQTNIALIDQKQDQQSKHIEQIQKDVHSMKTKQDGVLNVAIEGMKDMIKRHDEDRAQFMRFLNNNTKYQIHE